MRSNHDTRTENQITAKQSSAQRKAQSNNYLFFQPWIIILVFFVLSKFSSNVKLSRLVDPVALSSLGLFRYFLNDSLSWKSLFCKHFKLTYCKATWLFLNQDFHEPSKILHSDRFQQDLSFEDFHRRLGRTSTSYRSLGRNF